MSAAAGVARGSRRALCGAILLGLSLMCAALAVTASSDPMSGMSEMSGATAVVTAPVAAARDSMAPMAPMSSACDSVCVSEVTDLCSLAAGLSVMTLMALLLATRRDTFLGLLARVRTPPSGPRRRSEPPPWTVLSLSSLCVLRV